VSNGRGILLARDGATLGLCVVCKKPAPSEHLAPTGPREGLCAACWTRAAQLRGWLMQPALGNSGVPVLQVMSALLGLCGGRGADMGPVRTLVRVIEERERMAAAERWDEEGLIHAPTPEEQPACCYCHLAPAGPEDTAVMESLTPTEAEDGLPRIWHCYDVAACDARLFRRLMVLVAKVAEAAKAVEGLVAQ